MGFPLLRRLLPLGCGQGHIYLEVDVIMNGASQGHGAALRIGPSDPEAMMEIHERSATEIARAIRDRELSAVRVVDHFLDRIERLAGDLNCVITVTSDLAREQARAVDSALERGEAGSALMGVPILLKDNISLSGILTTCASRSLEGYTPIFDATVVEKLKAAGLPILGKTNMDEFAMGSSCEHSSRGPCRNPWDTDRVSGGSSGGSACAVAARLAPLALGSDTGGSIRLPASYCGVAGLKPTYGAVSRYGLVAFASSLDQIGGFSHHIEDMAALHTLISGHDPRDSTSELREPEAPDFNRGLDGLRVGIVDEMMGPGIDEGVRARVEEGIRVLEASGASLVSVSLPHMKYGVAAYYVLSSAEASSNLARYDGVRYGSRVPGDDLISQFTLTRDAGLGAEVKRRIILGTFVLSSGYYDAYYARAQKVRTLIRRDFERAFEVCDVLAGPIAPTPAFMVGEKQNDPVSMYLVDICTITANLAGLPGLSLPCGFVSVGERQLPVGMQIIGRGFDETTILRVGFKYQQQTDHHTRAPA